MQSVDKLIEIVKKLRSPEGCPWDREQTHKSIRGHLVEECAELLETIDLEDFPHMQEELGDLLMHIVLHSEIASEEGHFTFDDVVNEISEKLVRRHPHVFSDKNANNSDEVLQIWKDVKKQEKLDKGKFVSDNFFDNIPPSLSALRIAYEAAKKSSDSAIKKANSELEKSNNLSANCGKKIFEAVMFTVSQKFEPESALRDYIALLRKNHES